MTHDVAGPSVASAGSLLLCALAIGIVVAVAVDHGPHWVSVRERLPPTDDGTPDATVLVFNRTDVIQAWREQDGHFTGVTGEHIPRVTHWMKMPEPPRE
jgi:hypothetical protein